MKNIKTLSTLVLAAAVIATAQTVNATTIMTGDTGLGVGLGGAVIVRYTGGYTGCELGNNSATLGFDSNATVNWSALNLNQGEALNFNANDGVNGITVVNTVTGNASYIYGNISANEGISKLIISNPNGMLFDGCHFTTAGDVELNAPYVEGQDAYHNIVTGNGSYDQVIIKFQNSNVDVGGEFSIIAPNVNLRNSHFGLGAGKSLRLSTTDGSTFSTTGTTFTGDRETDGRYGTGYRSVTLYSIEVDGNVEIVADEKGDMVSINGNTTINGNLDVDSNSVYVNLANSASQNLTVTGDANIHANGSIASISRANIGGNLNVQNDNGVVEIRNVNVGNNMSLVTDAGETPNSKGVKSEVWIAGDNHVGGNVFISALHNIFFGSRLNQKGSLTAGGNVTAHAIDGHVVVTSDITADNISLWSDNYNILSNGEAVLSANTYEFYSNGYIGGLGTCIVEHGAEAQDLRSIVESYTFVPSLEVLAENGIMYADDTFNNLRNSKALILNGGTITNIIAKYAKIDSLGDLKIEHASIGEDMRISAIDSNLDLSSDDIHARVIYVGDKTDSLTVATESRDFVTSFFSIHQGDIHGPASLRPDEVLTGELADMHNTPKEGLERAEDTTLINGKGAPVNPPVDPVDPIDPVNPTDPTSVDSSDNVKVLNSMNNDLLSQATDAAPVNTPTAYAADLDDDDNASAPIRQNVDGSVTIVKEMVAD